MHLIPMRGRDQQKAGPASIGSRIIDRFGERASAIEDGDQLEQLIAEATHELGFDHFAVLHHDSLSRPSRRMVMIHSYPGGWAEELMGAAPAKDVDPVHRASIRTHVGFRWCELPQLVRLGSAERRFLDRAKRHDIADGFTVPVNVPGEPPGSCSFALRRGSAMPDRRLYCAEQVGLHAFRAARRIHGYPENGRRPKLSRRELQCVRLVAAGKTDWEIAAILGISVETAHQYVKRARAAYDVVSRAQLVACGLRDALVSFGEAIPPFG
jgi:LuxR family transcriptional regulator, quorum-sensing system regulator CciR